MERAKLREEQKQSAERPQPDSGDKAEEEEIKEEETKQESTEA